jgi:pimeloyl-ACP methyl ester carboxylesterase
MTRKSTSRGVPRSGRVSTEGDDLYYEVRGQGPPLLMIAGGGGDGGAYSAVADFLCDEFMVITFDRRGNARSTMNDPQNFEVTQQSRDAVAVLHAAGETSAFVFGNSSGAVIGLDMAKTQPNAVKALVAHEPPVPRVLPDARKWQRLFARVYCTAFRLGGTLAMLRFALGIGLDYSFHGALVAARAARQARRMSGERYLPRSVVTDHFLRYELLTITNYLPDVGAIRRNKVRVYMAAGRRSLDKRRFYAETARVLASRFGGELITFPGHHGSFVDMPEEWAAVLRRTFHLST